MSVHEGLKAYIVDHQNKIKHINTLVNNDKLTDLLEKTTKALAEVQEEIKQSREEVKRSREEREEAKEEKRRKEILWSAFIILYEMVQKITELARKRVKKALLTDVHSLHEDDTVRFFKYHPGTMSVRFNVAREYLPDGKNVGTLTIPSKCTKFKKVQLGRCFYGSLLQY